MKENRSEKLRCVTCLVNSQFLLSPWLIPGKSTLSNYSANRRFLSSPLLSAKKSSRLNCSSRSRFLSSLWLSPTKVRYTACSFLEQVCNEEGNSRNKKEEYHQILDRPLIHPGGNLHPCENRCKHKGIEHQGPGKCLQGNNSIDQI